MLRIPHAANLVTTPFLCARLAQSRQLVHGRCSRRCEGRRIQLGFSISPPSSARLLAPDALEMREIAIDIRPPRAPARPGAHAAPPGVDGNRVALSGFLFRRLCVHVCLGKNLSLCGIPMASNLAVPST